MLLNSFTDPKSIYRVHPPLPFSAILTPHPYILGALDSPSYLGDPINSVPLWFNSSLVTQGIQPPRIQKPQLLTKQHPRRQPFSRRKPEPQPMPREPHREEHIRLPRQC